MKRKMPLFIFLAFLAFLGVLCASCARTSDVPARPDLELYHYDWDLELEPQENAPLATADGTVQKVSFMSSHDERVEAVLAKPAGADQPCPVVIYVHGMGDNKESSVKLPVAGEFLKRGWAVAAIDAQYHGARNVKGRSKKIHEPLSYTKRDALIQTVTDIRRLVDYIETRSDLDASRIALCGHSMGSFIGVIACAVEERICTGVFMVGGGGFEDVIFPENYKKDRWTAREEARIRELIRCMDPALFVAMIAPRPVLMVNGERDEAVPPNLGRALYEAAAKPKRIIWKDAGHEAATLAFPEIVGHIEESFSRED